MVTSLNKTIHVLILFGFLLSVFITYAEQITVEGQSQGRRATLSAITENQMLYVPADELAGVLGMTFYENQQKKKMVFNHANGSLTFSYRNPFVLVDKEPFQMLSPTLIKSERLYIPLYYFLYTLNDKLPRPMYYDPSSGVLLFTEGKYNIQDVTVEVKQNGSILHIMTAKAFKLSDVELSVHHQRLNVTLLGGTLDTLQIASFTAIGLIDSIVSFQFRESAQITFQLNHTLTSKEVELLPKEIRITLRSGQDVPAPVRTDLQSGSDKNNWLIDTIIIDPGHGGRDPGAIGVTKLKEKDVNLRISNLLKEYLESRLKGVRILLTRESDTLPALRERTEFANKNKGKLFISIHANANESSGVNGFSTYIFGQGRSKEAIEVAQAENSVIQYEENQEVYKEMESTAFILNLIAHNEYMKESQDLAAMMGEEIQLKTKLKNTGVHQGEYWVLVGAAMPRVLVETAYLSNRYDERVLKSKTDQRKIAEAIGESIIQFKKKYEKDIG